MTKSKQIEKLAQIWGKEYKKGLISYLILLLLKEHPMYGLQINKKLVETAENKILFQESNIYQVLKKLKKTGLVSVALKKSDIGPRRKYYTMEKKGENLLNYFTGEYIHPIMNILTKLVNKSNLNLK